MRGSAGSLCIQKVNESQDLQQLIALDSTPTEFNGIISFPVS